MNLKTDLLVLCSSSLFMSFVQFFCSSIVFKALKTFAGVKSNYMIKELSLLFLNSLNLKTELGFCIILFQSKYLLKEFSLLFFNFLNFKTDLSVMCSSFLFKFFVQFLFKVLPKLNFQVQKAKRWERIIIANSLNKIGF